jgi:nucleoside-diphosphate-sugar epimerase
MDRILVTGATGFVGRHLCRELVRRSAPVVAAVRASSPTDCLPSQVTRQVVGEIGPDTAWDAKCFERVDTVVHLAARVHVLKERAADPAAEFFKTNVAGTERLARAAAGRVRRLVYVSSLHAMRTISSEVLTEKSVCQPDSPYGQSKLNAEQRLKAIARETGLELVIVRPPPVYGPGGVGNLLSLLRWVRRGWPLPLGGVQNQRSLVYVDNLVDALIRVITAPNAVDGVFLVSDGENVSISELVRRAAAAFQRPARLLPAPASLMRLAGRISGKRSSVERMLGSLAVDISHLRQTLAWSPVFSLDESLRKTALWLEHNS